MCRTPPLLLLPALQRFCPCLVGFLPLMRTRVANVSPQQQGCPALLPASAHCRQSCGLGRAAPHPAPCTQQQQPLPYRRRLTRQTAAACA